MFFKLIISNFCLNFSIFIFKQMIFNYLFFELIIFHILIIWNLTSLSRYSFMDCSLEIKFCWMVFLLYIYIYYTYYYMKYIWIYSNLYFFEFMNLFIFIFFIFYEFNLRIIWFIIWFMLFCVFSYDFVTQVFFFIKIHFNIIDNLNY